MRTETRNGLTILTADDGKILVSAGVYSEKVFLGKYDSPENWKEVDENAEREEPQDKELSAEEALEIITGGTP